MLHNWRLLFIVEGVPTILMGVVTIFLLPDRPEETPFLTEEERKLQLRRMNRGLAADVGRTVNKSACVHRAIAPPSETRSFRRTHCGRIQGLAGEQRPLRVSFALLTLMSWRRSTRPE